jgi:hypothetical protein
MYFCILYSLIDRDALGVDVVPAGFDGFAGEVIDPVCGNGEVDIAFVTGAGCDRCNEQVVAEEPLVVDLVGFTVIGVVHDEGTYRRLAGGVVVFECLFQHRDELFAELQEFADFVFAAVADPRNTVVVPCVDEALYGENNRLEPPEELLFGMGIPQLRTPQKAGEGGGGDAADNLDFSTFDARR